MNENANLKSKTKREICNKFVKNVFNKEEELILLILKMKPVMML